MVGVFEEVFDLRGHTDDVESEEVAASASGELQESDLIRLSFTETGACLGVEADDVRAAEVVDGVGHTVEGIDDDDVAVVFSGREHREISF